MLRLLAAPFLLALLAVAPAAAAPGDAMIIIANKTYRGGIPPVEFADRDAGEIAKAALAANVLGIPVTAVKRLDDLTQGEADSWFRADGSPGEELVAFLRRATLGRRDATVYFYYSGHGIAAKSELRGADELHLVLNDTRTAAVARSALSIEAAKLALAKAGPPEGRIIMWVDACFSGLGRDGRQLWDGARMVGDVASAVKTKAPERLVMLSAAAGDEPAWSDAKRKHGAFTDALLDGLYGGAAGSDGQVTAEALLAFVSRRVNERLARQGRGQTPILIGDQSARIAHLKRPFPERNPGERRQLELRCTVVAASRNPNDIRRFLDEECADDCPCQERILRHLSTVDGETRTCIAEAKMLEALIAQGAPPVAQLEALKGAASCDDVRQRITALLADIQAKQFAQRKKALAAAEAREKAERELQELAKAKAEEALRRADEARRLEELETKRKAEEEARRRAEEERLREMRSRRHAATAVGRIESTRRLFALTVTDQPSIAEAETLAMTRCQQAAGDCRIMARFSGPGRCVFVAGGTSILNQYGRVVRHVGYATAGTEAEALQKCRSRYQSCQVFHTRCNSAS